MGKRKVLVAFALIASCGKPSRVEPSQPASPMIASTKQTTPVAAASPQVGDLRKVGHVDFQISCRAELQPSFVRAMALLHSFFYQEARRLFTEISSKDPSCAISQWGIAMTWYHPVWAPPTPEEMTKGRAAIEAAQKASEKSPREKAFIDALAVFYASDAPSTPAPGEGGMSCHGPTGGHSGRALAYEAAMAKVFEAYPADDEAAAFYALSLLGSAKAVDPTFANQHKAAAILEKLWARHRDHPGVAHYLIHAYDSPTLAAKGLDAAKAYADIAPWVPHALHMPSHIFVRLGMWKESIISNQASMEAARTYVREQKLDGTTFEELHALDYLVYSDLQIGQDGKAKELAEYVTGVKKTIPEIDFVASYAVGSVPARYAVERHAWKEAAALTVPTEVFWAKFPFTEAHLEYARGLGRARSGDLAGAKESYARLGALRDATSDPRFDYFKQHLALQQQAISGWIAHLEGKNDRALAELRKAAELEELLGKNAVSPGPINIMYEQLGDLLLELGKPTDALAAYETGLKSSPGRLNSILGAGVAAETAGKRDVARKYYEQAVAQTAGGDTQRPELDRAKKFLAK